MEELNEYYLDQERENAELVGCWWFVIKWVGFALFFMWIGSKL